MKNHKHLHKNNSICCLDISQQVAVLSCINQKYEAVVYHLLMHYIIKSERMQENIIHTFFTQKDTSTAPPDMIFHVAGVIVKVSLLYSIKYQRELHLSFSKMLLQNPEKLNRRKHKK